MNSNRFAREIYNSRLLLTGAIRYLSLLFFLLALAPAADNVLVYLYYSMTGPPLLPGESMDWVSLILGAGPGHFLLAAFSATCFFLASRIARHLIRIPLSLECPKCRFSLDNFRAERCPECGLYLGEDFHAPPPPTETPVE